MTQQHAAARLASHAIVPAGPSDTEVLSQLIADAFFPLDVCRWLIPDGAARRQIFPAYFQMYVEHAMADGLVHTTPDRAAAALWIPGTGPSAPPGGYDQWLAEVTGPWVERFRIFDEQLEAHHLSGAEHHHLAILAVRPDRQGQGTGTALLQAHHAALDELGIAAYLEASSERTRQIYLRHGYDDYGGPIALPGKWPAGTSPGEPPAAAFMYPMRRQPRPARNGTGRRYQ
jgi:GNAT superfamily N-acetyltransferase